MGAINGSYIPITAPHQYEGQLYYCQKGFLAVILQGMVDENVNFGIMILDKQAVAMIGQFSKEVI